MKPSGPFVFWSLQVMVRADGDLVQLDRTGDYLPDLREQLLLMLDRFPAPKPDPRALPPDHQVTVNTPRSKATARKPQRR